MRNPVELKIDVAVKGIRLSPALADLATLNPASAARDFASRGLEVILPQDIIAECPIATPMAADSPYVLDCENDAFFLCNSEDGTQVPVSLIAPPRFYCATTTEGTPMWQVATVHAGYLSIDPASACGFSARGLGCQFCTLAQTDGVVRAPRPIEEVLEVVRAAFDEGAAEFVYFNTGHFEAEDGGFAFLEPYVRAVKRHFDTLVAVQVHPPADDRWIDRCYASGVDALSYSLQIFDPEILATICRGRNQLIGRERYLCALEYAARIFPSGTVWSDLIVGLEPVESTLAGIDELTSSGVVPVLSLFRPLEETALRNHAPPDPEQVTPLYAHLYERVRAARINVQHMRDLGYAITPIEARFFAGDEARIDVAVSSFYRSRIGSRAVRGLSKLRRRLRVKRVSDSFNASRL